MLEKMIGIDKRNHCTLVTTKWGCTANPQIEEKREEDLLEKPHLFGAMIQTANSATMARFEERTRGQALAMIKPMLTKKFAPQISVQMVDDNGPRLALGETDAGMIVADGLKKLAQVTKKKSSCTLNGTSWHRILMNGSLRTSNASAIN
jgi:hypothetical protein